MKKFIIGIAMLILFFAGLALVISVDWRIALGIYLMMSANNWGQKY